MNKFLMLTGIFAVLTYNVAHAQRYYEENSYYVEEQPRYVRGSAEPRYYEETPRYVRSSETPRYARSSEEPRQYRRLNREDERRYQEREYARNDYRPQNTIRPYIGVDVMTSSVKFGNGTDNWSMKDEDTGEKYFKDEFTSGSIILGARINTKWGVEAFYQKSGEEDKKDSGEEDRFIWSETDTISFKAYGIDAQHYIPVNQDFEVLVSLGLAQYDFKAKAMYEDKLFGLSGTFVLSEKKDFDSLGIRLGIGGQYYLTKNLALRAMARYVKMNDDDYVKNLTELSLGLRYMF